MKEEETAQEPIYLLSTEYSTGSSYLIATMYDQASNDAAMGTLSIIYPYFFDVHVFHIPLGENYLYFYSYN